MTEIRFLSKIQTPPESSVKCYQCRIPAFNEEIGGEIANKFGIPYGKRLIAMDSTSRDMPQTGVTIEKNEFRYLYRKGHQHLSVANASGGIEYKKLSTFNRDIGIAVTYSDEEAVSLAKEKAREFDLAPLNECRFLNIKHFMTGNTDLQTRNSTNRIVNVSVIFQRTIDKIPVEGPGGKLAIVLDAEGEMCGVHRVWREIIPEKAKPMKIQPTSFAHESLTGRFNQYKGMVIEVTEQKFGYWEMGPDEVQKYLQPVFVITYDIIGPAGSINRKGIHVVPAGENPMPGLEFKKLVYTSRPASTRRES